MRGSRRREAHATLTEGAPERSFGSVGSSLKVAPSASSLPPFRGSSTASPRPWEVFAPVRIGLGLVGVVMTRLEGTPSTLFGDFFKPRLAVVVDRTGKGPPPHTAAAGQGGRQNVLASSFRPQ